MALTILAAISATLWAPVVIFLLPSLVRIYRNRQHVGDEWRAACLFQAVLIVAFNMRRIIMGHNTQALPGLYALSILLAVYVLVLLWRKRQG